MKKSLTGLLFICNLVLFSATGLAQTTSTPYSNFGIGDIQYNHFGRSKGMGGAAIGLRIPNTINSINPASYSSVGTQSFIFDAGLEYTQSNYVTNELAQIANGGALTHLAIAFPLINNRWYSSIGMQPYSTIGYNLTTYSYDKDAGDISNIYKGSGGINKMYWGHSVKVVKGLSVGFNASYLFGSILKETNSSISDEKTTSQLIINDEQVIRDFKLEYGMQYSYSISDNIEVTLGGTFTPASKLKTERSTLVTNSVFVDSRGSYQPSTLASHIDTLQHSVNDSQGIASPMQYGIGASFLLWKRLIIAGDYKKSLWSEENTESLNGKLVDAQMMNFGVDYLPNYRSMKYWDRVHYRAGAEINQSYWEINGKQITNFGVTVGLGLPMRRSASSFDLAFEFGQRGTLQSNLIKETYIKASVSFTLQDVWFIKRKFN